MGRRQRRRRMACWDLVGNIEGNVDELFKASVGHGRVK